jgi:tetratricopeptide (TPR) repeat protein
VPLYAVEIVRTLVDRGVLVAGAGGYTVTGDLGPLEIPETLQALISSRLDSLPAHQRALLQDAAVLGTTFSAEALAAVHGTATSALEGDLRDLVRKEFLALDTDPRSPERGHYGFVQGLIQEVASSRLARRDRSAKHLAVAHYYEELHDDELTAAVAAHYVAGFRAMPEGPQADEVAAAARDWLSRAGARALSLGSPEQALAFLDQALEVTTGRDRTPLLELAAEAAIRSANYSRAVPMLEEALSLSETDADTDAAARTSARLARALTGDRRYSEAITCVERVWPAARDGHDNRLRAELACEIAGAFTHAGTDGAASLEWAETALQNAERINDSALLARAIGTRSLSLFNQGRRREAAILARGMAALADEAGDLREQALARMGLSVFALYDDPRSSVTVALESADMARRAGQRHIEFTNLLNAAETSVYLGSWDDTRRALDAIAARDIPSDSRTWVEYIRALLAALTGDVAGVLERFGTELPPGEADVDIYATYLTSRAMARLAAGDLEGARADASRGVAKNPLGINSPMCLAVQIRASSWLRDAAGTRAALEGLRGFVGRWVEAVSLTAEASLAALEGDVGRAAETFRRCFDSWKVLDSPLDLALAQLSLVILLGPDHPEAAVAKEARDIFTELGAGPFLARLDDASRGAAAAHARPLQS